MDLAFKVLQSLPRFWLCAIFVENSPYFQFGDLLCIMSCLATHLLLIFKVDHLCCG